MYISCIVHMWYNIMHAIYIRELFRSGFFLFLISGIQVKNPKKDIGECLLVWFNFTDITNCGTDHVSSRLRSGVGFFLLDNTYFSVASAPFPLQFCISLS